VGTLPAAAGLICVFERFGVPDLSRQNVVDFEIPEPAHPFDATLKCEFSGRPASAFFWMWAHARIFR